MPSTSSGTPALTARTTARIADDATNNGRGVAHSVTWRRTAARAPATGAAAAGVIGALISFMEAGTQQRPPQRQQKRQQADSGARPRARSGGQEPGAGVGMSPPRTEEQCTIVFLERQNEELDIIRRLREDFAALRAAAGGALHQALLSRRSSMLKSLRGPAGGAARAPRPAAAGGKGAENHGQQRRE